jgi:hypothetical protein
MNAPHESTGALKAALEYGKRGWPVFQTFIQGGKLLPASAAKDGGPRWDATTDPKEIKRRWTINPNAGVAIATGQTARILVVDIDTIKGHGEDGYASLAELESSNGLIPLTISAATPSGGQHLYFKYPAGRNIGNGTNKIAKGIDHRGDGGYVNAVPSVRPAGAYSWEYPIEFLDPADCPEWLLNLMEKKPPPTLSERAMPPSPLKVTTASRWADAALTAEVSALWATPTGQRNHQLNKSAFNLGQIVAGGGLDRVTVEQEMTAAAKDAGLESGETIATIKSGLEAGMREPRTAAPRASDSQPKPSTIRKPDMSLLDNPRADAPIFDPVRLFGKDWGDWVRTAAEGGAAPADYTAATLLSVAGSLIGNARWVKVSHSWQEPPLIWTMLIGNPSAGKTPGAKPVRRALVEIEQEARKSIASEIEAWEKEAALCKLKLSAWQADAKRAFAKGGEPPPEPDGPGPRPWSPRLSLSDTTIEAAAQVLASQPKGLLVNRDELAGVLGNLTRYANGGSDGPFYLEGYTGGSFASERKGSGSIYVSRLSLTLTGTIQPERLATLLLKAEDDGMLARFMPIFPELVPVGVSEVPEDFLFSQEALLKLHRLKMVSVDIDNPDADLRPLFVHFTEKSLAAMTDFRRYCRELEGQHYGLMISHIGKLPGMAARLSLILAYLDWAAGDVGLGEPLEIELDVFNRATDFCRDYVVPMASRAYAEAATPPAERAAMSLAHLILEERLTDLNPRVISRRNRSGLKDAREVKAAIAILVDAHWLTEHSIETAGAPKTVWVVNPQVFN